MATSLKVWSRFSVTKDTGTIKFRTVTPPQERINDVADFVLEYFAKEESFFRASGNSFLIHDNKSDLILFKNKKIK